MQRCPTFGLQVGIDLVETGDGAVPIAFEVQMVFQPADELDGPLGEPLDGVLDAGRLAG